MTSSCRSWLMVWDMKALSCLPTGTCSDAAFRGLTPGRLLNGLKDSNSPVSRLMVGAGGCCSLLELAALAVADFAAVSFPKTKIPASAVGKRCGDSTLGPNVSDGPLGVRSAATAGPSVGEPCAALASTALSWSLLASTCCITRSICSAERSDCMRADSSARRDSCSIISATFAFCACMASSILLLRSLSLIVRGVSTGTVGARGGSGCLGLSTMTC